ncbi:MAG: hypothetical protein ACRDI2_05290 [Chloroflexota bacterium]
MPAPLDLAGRRLGRLVVLEPAGHVRYGHRTRAWRCRCDCGTEIVVPRTRLPYADYLRRYRRDMVEACPGCRAKACKVCGTRIPPERSRRVTCSDECAIKHRQAIQLDHYYRAAARDPELNLRRHAKVRDRMAVDTAYAARWREQNEAARRRRQQKIASNPALRAAVNARARAHYAAHAQEINAARRKRIDAMTPEARARWLERVRASGRAYQARWRKQITAQQEAHQAYLDLMREYRRQRALARMSVDAAKLAERIQT